MIIIKTKYLSATNTRGVRIKASANGFSHTILYPYDLSGEFAHFEAVQELVKKHNLEWDVSTMVYGGDTGGYYFAFPESTISGN